MGEVWKARDARLDRLVAIKVLRPEVASDPDRLCRFTREAKAVAALNHPNILTVHDVGLDDGTPYVVTELLEGESLREVLSQRSPTQRQALGWAVQTALGLAAAHQKGIVHRDLKPENIFLTGDGRIKILDFGLAKLTDPTPLDTKGVTESVATAAGVVMGTVSYMSPEQVQGLPVDARSDIFSLGVVLYELLAKINPFQRASTNATLAAILQEAPVPITNVDPSLPRALDGILRRCFEKEREQRFQGVHDLGLALEAVLAAPAASAVLDEVEERSPYPGLSSFTEADARHFFGREAECKALWEKVRARRMLAVIGPSGAGKTSFVRAGVVAGRPAGWAAIVSTPGSAPLRNLGQALGPELSRDPEALRRIAGFEDPDTAFELVARWRRSHDVALVVVDQFEELFTLNLPEVQARFASLLGRLAAEADVHVLLSLRDDFLMRCHEHASLSPVFGDLTPLGAMSCEGLRRAVVEPAARQGYAFEDADLVEEMIGSVENARGALPLLAFAVSRLWDRRVREKRVLTRKAYEEIGGVAGALAQHAEATLDRIGPASEGLVREIFRNLVTAQGTRAVLDREELLSALPNRAVAERVLDQLIDARLLTSWDSQSAEGGHTRHFVEIIHESLLSSWPRLVRWRSQDSDGALLRDQLRQAAHLWQERGKTEDLLWTGASYLDYRAWRERYPGGLSTVEEEFAAGMAALASRKKVRRRAASSVLLAAAVIVAAGLGAMWRRAVRATSRAQAETQRAEASKLLTLAQLKLKADPTEALALATASLELSDTHEARLVALRALEESPPAWEVTSEIGIGFLVRFSPDGRQLAVSGSAEVGVWSENGGPMIRLATEEMSRMFTMARWPSNRLLVTGPVRGRLVNVWSMPGGTKIRTIHFGMPSDWQVGPDRLFSETLDNAPRHPIVGNLSLRSWQLPEGEAEALGRIDKIGDEDSSGLFEPFGRAYLYTQGTATHLVSLRPATRTARIFSRHPANVSLSSTNRPDVLSQHDDSGENRLVFFSQDGPPVTTVFPKPASAPRSVRSTGSDRWTRGEPDAEAKLRLWDTKGLPGARSLDLRRESSWYGATADLDPQARFVAVSTSSMRRLTLWPLPSQQPNVVDGYVIKHRVLAFSPDGKWLATNWADNRLRLWPLPGNPDDVRPLDPHATGPWRGLAFDPMGRYLFAVGIPDKAWVLPLDGSPGRNLEKDSTDVFLQAAAVSPSGRHVASAFLRGEKGSRTLRVWDVETGAVRRFDLPLPEPPPGVPPPTGHEGGILTLAFLDESTLLTAGHGGIRRWNLGTGAHVLIRAVPYDHWVEMRLSSDQRELFFCEVERKSLGAVASGAIDLSTGAVRAVSGLGEIPSIGLPASRLATQGKAIAMLGPEASVGVALRSGGEPHWLLGHAGAVQSVAISPDLRWVASAGEDNTLRLWPMPDLSKPPLQSLPHEELLAKLKSLTNLRAVRDPASSTGWKIELGPFPGWKDLPAWEP